jgi:hypothetical protein
MDMMVVMNNTMDQRVSEFEARIPEPGPPPELAALSEHVASLEECVLANGKKLHLIRTNVQQIASSLGIFNATSPTLDDSLPMVLGASLNSANGRIQTLCGELPELKEKVQALEESQKASDNIMDVGRLHQESTNFDITSIRPYPLMAANWRDPPDLPQINPFNNVGELVDYVYRFVPKLQAHLEATHVKTVELATELTAKVEKSIMEKLFERFQAIARDAHDRAEYLTRVVEDMPSRAEISRMITESLGPLIEDSETSVGRVKCMACGRTVSQVAGIQRITAVDQAKERFGLDLIEETGSGRTVRSPSRVQGRPEPMGD